MVNRCRRSSSSKSPSTALNQSASLVSGARCWGTSYRRHRRGLLLGTISIARCRLSVRARRGMRESDDCRWLQRVVHRDAGHRGQRVLSRLRGREGVLVLSPWTESGARGPAATPCARSDARGRAREHREVASYFQRVQWLHDNAEEAVLLWHTSSTAGNCGRSTSSLTEASSGRTMSRSQAVSGETATDRGPLRLRARLPIGLGGMTLRPYR
jgi:hypothetical protein